MIERRRGVFETNSSSTHALCLRKENERLDLKIESIDWNFEYYIEPFSPEEYSAWSDPMILSTIKDKLRYFWTIYNNLYLDDEVAGSGCSEWMRKIQSWMPNVKWVIQFNTNLDDDWGLYKRGVYLEDYDYVMMDEDEALIDHISDEDSFKNFMLHGVVVFGDRDLPSREYGDSAVEDMIARFDKIAACSG